MLRRPIAEFDDSDDALRFAKLKGADYTLCDGEKRPWGVRAKSRRECGLGDPFSPPDSYIEHNEENDDGT